MRTRIEVGPDHCVLTHGLLWARRTRAAPGEAARVALVAGQALLLRGDHVEVEVDVTGPLLVRIIEPAGTVAYDMRGGSARWDVSVTLRDGAHVVWDAEPFVVSSGADVRRRTVLHVGDGCTARLRETLVLGRHGQVGGAVRTTTRAFLGGLPALAEDLDLGVSERAGWAVLGTHRVLDSVTVLGERLPDDENTLQLDVTGSVVRWLGDETHASPLERVRKGGG